jgi:phosphoribosyl 1,2-cyclic phosphodiesterase
MSLQVTALASGSSGNAFLVETTTSALLVEAGLAARTLERYLRLRDVEPAELAAIVISHEHHDHTQGAGPLARRYNIPIVCSPGTARAMHAEWQGLRIVPLADPGTRIGEVELSGVVVPHDAVEPLAIMVEHDGYAAAWALDLGHAPAHLVPFLARADLVIVEANHDREKLITAAPYSWPIKNRILSERGHLSNLQASELLAQIGADGRQRTAWLAHLSERANDHPRGVLRYVQNYLDMAGVKRLNLRIAERNRPSAAWDSRQALEQGNLLEPLQHSLELYGLG